MFNTFFDYERGARMNELRVLGIGSPFGDDQLGWEVVKLLQQRATLSQFIPDRLHLAYCDRPGMQLLELMRHAQTVILIDAIKTGAVIGTLHQFKNQDIEAMSNSLSTHAFGIAEAMKMGAVLHELPPNVLLYGVEIGDISFQFNLSEPIIRAINDLSDQLEKDILHALD